MVECCYAVMLNVIMLSVILLSVVMVSVDMQSVVVPYDSVSSYLHLTMNNILLINLFILDSNGNTVVEHSTHNPNI